LNNLEHLGQKDQFVEKIAKLENDFLKRHIEMPNYYLFERRTIQKIDYRYIEPFECFPVNILKKKYEKFLKLFSYHLQFQFYKLDMNCFEKTIEKDKTCGKHGYIQCKRISKRMKNKLNTLATHPYY
jgi:hypothetical protein